MRDFPALFERAKQNLKPGGWIEFVDFTAEPWADDDSLDRAPNIVELYKLMDEASVSFGKQQNVARYYKKWMIDAGFKNVKEDVFKVCLVCHLWLLSKYPDILTYLLSPQLDPLQPLGQRSQNEGARPLSAGKPARSPGSIYLGAFYPRVGLVYRKGTGIQCRGPY